MTSVRSHSYDYPIGPDERINNFSYRLPGNCLRDINQVPDNAAIIVIFLKLQGLKSITLQQLT